MKRTVLGVLLPMLLGLGCNNTPAAVGDRFVDLYFVEIDQVRLRPITTGLAARKIEDELRLVEDIRRSYDPEESKPSVFYTRKGLMVRGERARATYDVTVRRGNDETHRHVMVSIEQVAGRWKVGNFLITDGEDDAGAREGSSSRVRVRPGSGAPLPPALPSAPPPEVAAPPAPSPPH